ncbi:hypothetical protein GCM10027064_20080 [Microbacterium petrolearium]
MRVAELGQQVTLLEADLAKRDETIVARDEALARLAGKRCRFPGSTVELERTVIPAWKA